MPESRRRKIFTFKDRNITLNCTTVREWWLRRIPILEWAPKYKIREYLIPDCISGMMLAIQQVAQGLAFAVMSSVHPVFGLYGSLFPPLIYLIFGMGRHVSVGTFAITSLISAGAVERLVPLSNVNITNNSLGDLGLSDFEMQRIGVAAAVTFLGGVIQVSMFFLHLGCTTFLLSQPVVSAMTTGAATHVVTSQVKFLLGMKLPYISGPLGMFYIYVYIFKNINMVNIGVLLLSIVTLTLLVLTKELNEKFKAQIKFVIPIDLTLIIATSVACYFINLHEAYDFDIVGPMPTGIPLPQAPPMDVLQNVVVEAFSVALVGYTVSIYLAYNSAKRFKYPVCENQELFAHGLSNIIPSFFFCIPNAGAPARTFLLYSNGAKTQVAALVSCILVLVVIYVIVPYLYWLPMCVLASSVVVGLKGMLIQFQDLKKYWNVDKYDWVVWVCTYVVTICFAANIGLLFGVVFSVAVGILRLNRTNSLRVIHLQEEYSTMNDDELTELKVISIGAPVFFLNAKKLHTDILQMNCKLVSRTQSCRKNAGVLLTPVSNGDYNGLPQRASRMTLILNCSEITFFDFTGVTILTQVNESLKFLKKAAQGRESLRRSKASQCQFKYVWTGSRIVNVGGLTQIAYIVLDLKERGTDVMFSGCSAPLVKAIQYCDSGAKHLHFFNNINTALDAMMITKCSESTMEADSTDV